MLGKAGGVSLYILAIAIGVGQGAEQPTKHEKGRPTDAKSEAAQEPFELGEIVVTRGRPCGKDMTATVVEIDEQQIQALQAQTAADVLHHVPGAFVRIGNQGAAMVRLRGYRQREVKVLLDGVPLNNPYTGRKDLRDIPASSIAKIRVIKGGSSVLYGPNNVGGVIEIMTKKPTKKPSTILTAEAVADILAAGVTEVRTTDGQTLTEGRVANGEKLRPEIIGHRAVLIVAPGPDGAWQSVRRD